MAAAATVGIAGIALILVLQRWLPKVPAVLIMVVLAHVPEQSVTSHELCRTSPVMPSVPCVTAFTGARRTGTGHQLTPRPR